MKKIIMLVLAISLVFAMFTIPAFAADLSATLDGEEIACVDVNGNAVPPMLVDGTTYLPVRAVANALKLDIAWDDATKSVFINGAAEGAALSDAVNVYINGVKFTPRDVNNNVVNPILQDGTTYLPIRAIGQAFDKSVGWDQETMTAVLTTPNFKTDFDPDKTYSIINKSNSKAIAVTVLGVVTETANNSESQAFKLIPTAVEGYYNVQSVVDQTNLDVNANSTAAGGTIIAYAAGTGDNQMYAFVEEEDGFVIYARSSKLPIEDSASKIKQNVLRDSAAQRWDVVETTPVSSTPKIMYRTITMDGVALTDSGSLGVSTATSSDTQQWEFDAVTDGEYIITNKSTANSVDVSGQSTTPGDPIITYATSGDPNQRWILEPVGDGTYRIKSVHSSLYLSVAADNSIVQVEAANGAKIAWTVTTLD